ncbi:tRNA isopentenyltransferase [Sodiomyces alkalinus F11]|uniref:tRNA dimethylallyltransferase n=1 Tax=Sodiomyces alkalinus (strain CBS 110278 / VKM F-3762 / F11) TaxID=1314773 RepID=A0A3N2PWU2_SODAK|nr:tRNA isopentenyltransferase [Sodiomyces alkalinus F11]ROT38977.1 tRNA isopentenyltransferase [Sodiomyces alkalinus F11]
MATKNPPPREPLIFVLGSTGTGKSELAVELATRFNGEVINSDAMQLYKGLPIITNKITPSERRGVPHHLLDHIGLDDPPWVVDDFKRAATQAIQDIRARGRLPILVGGTHYYTNALLFDEVLVEGEKEEPSSSFPILSEPTDVILAKLRQVDPVMAARWHPNDRRKISRSLEIFLKYGRPASEIYAEQKRRKAAAAAAAVEGGGAGGGDTPSWQNLMFWVHTDPEVLKTRLDGRVDKMLAAGLLDETRQMFEHVRRKESAGQPVDFTRGIWQSIGFKELEPYLRASSSSSSSSVPEPADPADPADAVTLAALQSSGLEAVKISTRQYAKYQTRWIRTKVVPLLRDHPAGAMSRLFVLDTTDPAHWAEQVADPAASITRRFLADEPLPDPASLSPAARSVLEAVVAAAAPESPAALKQTPCQRTCELCRVTCVTEESWEKHLKSRRHNAIARRVKRRALVPVETSGEEAGEGPEMEKTQGERGTRGRRGEGDRSRTPDMDLGSIDFTPPG